MYRQSDWACHASADGKFSHASCLCNGSRSNVHDNHHHMADRTQRVRMQKRVVTNLNISYFFSVRGRGNRDQTCEKKTGPRMPLHPTTP